MAPGDRRAVERGRVSRRPAIRTPSRRAWKSVVLEVDVTSRYLPWPGIHASQSYFLAAEAPSSPTPMFTTRYGIVELRQDPLLEAEQLLVLGDGVVRRDEREHLDLVELMHAQDPARVATRRAGLAPEARRDARVAPRQGRPPRPRAATPARPRRSPSGRGRPRAARRSAARCRAGTPSRTAPPRARAPGGRLARTPPRRAARAPSARARDTPARRPRAGRRSASPRPGRRSPCRSGPPATREVVRALRAGGADLPQDLVLVGRRRIGRVGHAGQRRLELLLDSLQLVPQSRSGAP